MQDRAGLRLVAWGLRHPGGWLAAETLLLGAGGLGLSYDLTRPRD
ncbi:hypothetical protein ABTZ93_31460 [Streptomyces sp. NPDC097941]